ncbi:hypothetical protein DMUE_1877 [Dictyocoela muelleri]|nr:hypothetical protein DMUE_1877 [Dictyocoela muelleri]
MAQVIIDNVLPGSNIITDQWKAYERALQDMPEYLHRTVNYSINYVNSLDQDVHTQTIEWLWSLSKRFLKENNSISKEKPEDILTQLIWRNKIIKDKRFIQPLLLLRINN